MHHADGTDAVRAVGGEALADRGDVGAAAPVGVDELGGEAEAARHLLPQRREPAGAAHQHGIAGAERVAQRRLPRAGAGGGIDHHRAFGLEHAAQLGEQVAAEAAEIGAAMIHRRVVDRPQHPVGHVGGTGDLQEMAAGMGHGAGLPLCRGAGVRPEAGPIHDDDACRSL